MRFAQHRSKPLALSLTSTRSDGSYNNLRVAQTRCDDSLANLTSFSTRSCKRLDEGVPHAANGVLVLSRELEDRLDDRDFRRSRVEAGEGGPVCARGGSQRA